MQAILSTPRESLIATDVAEAESLRRGARVRHGCDVLRLDGTLTDEKLRFTEGSVTWSYRPPDPLSGQQAQVAAVRRRAQLQTVGPLGVDLVNRRIRLWTELQLLDGSWARYHLGVFDVPRPVVADDGNVLTRRLDLADKSHRWANTRTNEPVVIPGTAVGLTWVRDSLTSRFGESRFNFPTSTATIGQQLVIESGVSWLELYSRVLQAVAHDQLTADENGRPTTRPLAELATRSPEITYGPGHGKVLVAGEVEPLMPSLPNVVRFVARQTPSLGSAEGNGIRTKRNQSTGPGSIDARGGTGVGEVELRVDVPASSQVMLDAIADAEAARYFAGGGLRWTGRVGLQPRHSDRDVIGVELPRLELSGGAWNVTSWTYPLRPVTDDQAATMPITAERRVV